MEWYTQTLAVLAVAELPAHELPLPAPVEAAWAAAAGRWATALPPLEAARIVKKRRAVDRLRSVAGWLLLERLAGWVEEARAVVQQSVVSTSEGAPATQEEQQQRQRGSLADADAALETELLRPLVGGSDSSKVARCDANQRPYLVASRGDANMSHDGRWVVGFAAAAAPASPPTSLNGLAEGAASALPSCLCAELCRMPGDGDSHAAASLPGAAPPPPALTRPVWAGVDVVSWDVPITVWEQLVADGDVFSAGEVAWAGAVAAAAGAARPDCAACVAGVAGPGGTAAAPRLSVGALGALWALKEAYLKATGEGVSHFLAAGLRLADLDCCSSDDGGVATSSPKELGGLRVVPLQVVVHAGGCVPAGCGEGGEGEGSGTAPWRLAEGSLPLAWLTWPRQLARGADAASAHCAKWRAAVGLLRPQRACGDDGATSSLLDASSTPFTEGIEPDVNAFMNAFHELHACQGALCAVALHG